MTKSVLTALILGGLLFVGVQCNLFGVFAPSDNEEMLDRYGPEALIAEGKLKMRDGQWQEAYDLFDLALKQDSIRLSEAWFYKGKCILRLYGMDLQQVWDDINPDSLNKSDVPFLYRPPAGRGLLDSLPSPFVLSIRGRSDTAYTLIDSVFLQRKRIYDAVSQAVVCLERIHYDRFNMMDGKITRKQYESDYLVEISVKSVLGIIDYNHNDSLDYNSDERDIFRIMCSDIPSLDSMDFDSLKTISRDPKEINTTLDLILSTVLKADTSYNNFHSELIDAVAVNPDAGIDASVGSDVGRMISEFKNILPFYYYNNKKNDDEVKDTLIDGIPVRLSLHFNTDTTKEGVQIARVDRMIWIDWDHDNRIDVDETDRYHIGDPAHRTAFPQYYTSIDGPADNYSRYVYKGPHTYEFVAGDWGVDEEILDGEDNDGDGLTDEDSRIVADTLDDDGDYVEMTLGRTFALATPMPEQGKKLWLWGSGPYRLHPNTPFKPEDVGTVLTDAHGTKYRVTTVVDSGTVRALIDPALNPVYSWSVMPDSLNTIVTIRAEWPGHAVYDPVIWVDVNGNGVIDGVDRASPAYGSEFVAGDWGLDEEWFDGRDNDGDEEVDEDVGERLPPASQRSSIIAGQVR